MRLGCAPRLCNACAQTENVLLTSWSWVFLSDYAPYKPTFLPADNPVRLSACLRGSSAGGHRLDAS